MRAAALTVAATLASTLGAPAAMAAPMLPGFSSCSAMADEPGAPYYVVDLVPTGRVPGTRKAKGEARLAFARSAFGLAVNADGRYVYDLSVRFSGLAPQADDFVVWVAKADLSEIRPVGVLADPDGPAGTVDWNKFLVVVTLEPAGEPLADSWRGPIVFRGMSRSGRMHTMAGHGPFQAEPCAKYGY